MTGQRIAPPEYLAGPPDTTLPPPATLVVEAGLGVGFGVGFGGPLAPGRMSTCPTTSVGSSRPLSSTTLTLSTLNRFATESSVSVSLTVYTRPDTGGIKRPRPALRGDFFCLFGP